MVPIYTSDFTKWEQKYNSCELKFPFLSFPPYFTLEGASVAVICFIVILKLSPIQVMVHHFLHKLWDH